MLEKQSYNNNDKNIQNYYNISNISIPLAYALKSYETGISVFQDWKINLSSFILEGEINLDLHPCTSVLRCEKTIAFVLL